MGKRTSSKSKEGYYAAYKSQNKWKSNREKRLLKAMKEQPDNENIKAALGSMVYRRKKPVGKGWSKSDIAKAKLLKEFCGYVPKDIFSSNPKVQESALSGLHRKNFSKPLPTAKVSFRIVDRSYSWKPL